MRLGVIVLAAGEGKRMKSQKPKVLHPVAGLPMIRHVLNTVADVGAMAVAVVISSTGNEVREVIGEDVLYVVQEQQLGTGHAVSQARGVLERRTDEVMVLYGDMPLLTVETLQGLVQRHRQVREATITMLTVSSEDSMNFGRILRDRRGRVVGIVEEADATEKQRRITELNCGVYCFEADWLWSHLSRIPMSPSGEYYLTDLVGMAASEGRSVEAVGVEDVTQVQGINTRAHLARAEAIMRRRICGRLLNRGVTLIDPNTTYADMTVEVGPDTVIRPNTCLWGNTRIGRGCIIGPNAIIRDAVIGDGCRVMASVVEEAFLEDEVSVGPFGHLRKGAHLAKGVHVGNFGEVKNSRLGAGTKMGHFSYIGDATIGRDVNIGAGTVTCNYDGVRKNPTTLGDDVFVGSGTMLVAPVEVGAGAVIGAGSVVTHDVPPESIAYGVPARVRPKSESEAEPDEEAQAELASTDKDDVNA
ncbi:MAG: bifunctional UDP-N-acetylglucosamine diphosphorylase/glucosamine-1-phosphate N-acetyltransferase GlmU [Planctomycetes bacterium]|nr:bifunctional UDP-N-acetylglucosamine diphosphorylase/glucosamine-1-phosphate N-acetyltransferase GlmU [Planctomycetota bacterium]